MQDEEDRAPGRSGIQVIARAAAVLRALKDGGGGQSLGQIAERVGLPRSTVQRIVGALAEERLVIAGAQGGLRLGPEIDALAEATRHDVAVTCRPLLAALAEATGETADLSVLRGARMIFLDQVPGTQRLRTVSSVGEAFPLTTTANGRACLARLPEERAEALARAEWERTGGPGDAAALRATLDRVRATGLAYDLDEHTEGISAVGFAFADRSGDLHAVSVPVPSTRFAERRGAIEAALRDVAHQVRRALAAR